MAEYPYTKPTSDISWADTGARAEIIDEVVERGWADGASPAVEEWNALRHEAERKVSWAESQAVRTFDTLFEGYDAASPERHFASREHLEGVPLGQWVAKPSEYGVAGIVVTGCVGPYVIYTQSGETIWAKADPYSGTADTVWKTSMGGSPPVNPSLAYERTLVFQATGGGGEKIYDLYIGGILSVASFLTLQTPSVPATITALYMDETDIWSLIKDAASPSPGFYLSHHDAVTGAEITALAPLWNQDSSWTAAAPKLICDRDTAMVFDARGTGANVSVRWYGSGGRFSQTGLETYKWAPQSAATWNSMTPRADKNYTYLRLETYFMVICKKSGGVVWAQAHGVAGSSVNVFPDGRGVWSASPMGTAGLPANSLYWMSGGGHRQLWRRREGWGGPLVRLAGTADPLWQSPYGRW